MSDITLNRIPIEEVWNEITEEGSAAVKDVTAFLFSSTLPPSRNDSTWRTRMPDRARLAPSIITRSEIEVFGISLPRFCYRVYFQGSDAFLNLRRLKTLRHYVFQSVDSWKGKRVSNLRVDEQHARISSEVQNENIEDILPSGDFSFVIADCLLQPPPRYPLLDYDIIRAKLYREYGELVRLADESEPSKWWSPYVKTISFGGGLCAQACCFVATSILNEHSNGAHGLAEITALASSPSTKELLIAGLDENEMVSYFRNVGLNAIVQFGNPNVTSKEFKEAQDTDFREALHGYVASGMPVILLVDISTLQGEGAEGESIYKTNGWALKGEPPLRRHAITAVGCTKCMDLRSFESPWRRNADCAFLLHDSSAMPFMRATVAQLAEVGVWQKESVPYNMRHPALIPVTPSRVTVPLLCWGQPTEDGWKHGLIEISKRHGGKRRDPARREFILTRIGKMASRIIRIALHFSDVYHDQVASLISSVLLEQFRTRFHWDEEHWVWLECAPEAVTIWDAEAQCIKGEDMNDPAMLLRGVLEPHDGKLALRVIVHEHEFVFTAPEERPKARAGIATTKHQLIRTSNGDFAAASAKAGVERLLVSAISSFSVLGSREAASVWAQGSLSTNYVEFYACMQEDLAHFFPRHDSGKSAVQALGEQIASPGASKNFSQMIRACFKEQEVIAFATFIPEIMSPHLETVASAQNAIKFLVETASYFPPRERPFVIELVTGSRLRGVWRAKTTDEDISFVVNRLDGREAIVALLTNLRPIYEHAKHFSRIKLALELEPGPLFTLGDRIGLEQLGVLLDAPPYADLNRIIGLNLDVAHWAFLSGIEPQWLEQNQSIRNRIIHAHISDHSKGHFCDAVLGIHHPHDAFCPWVKFLCKLVNERGPEHILNYSGFVSCELEACKGSRFVDTCVKDVQGIINKVILSEGGDVAAKSE